MTDTTSEKIEYPPVTVAKLVDHVIGDSSADYDDGLGGYSSGTFDADTGVLTLRFERDQHLDEADAVKWDHVHGSAEYRFQLIPENAEDVSDGFHTFKELYQYRLLYNAALFNEWAEQGVHDVHKSERHHDGELAFGGGWFVVTAQLPAGQISNHYELRDWELFHVPIRESAAAWDGHTPAEAAERLLGFLRPSPF